MRGRQWITDFRKDRLHINTYSVLLGWCTGTDNIEKVYVLGASAGGTPAMRFALDDPERTTGIILLSSAPVWDKKPQKLPGVWDLPL